MKGTRDGARNGSAIVGVVEALTSVELGSTRTKLNNNRGIVAARGLETSIDTTARNAVYGRDCVS